MSSAGFPAGTTGVIDTNRLSSESKVLSGCYPHVTGLENDEWGHPSDNPKMHQKMTDKRRNKLVAFANKLPLPQVYGDHEGDALLIGWGSSYGPIKEV